VNWVALLRNATVLVLTAMVVVSLIGMGVLTYQTAFLTWGYTDVEGNVFLEIVSIRDTNGSLSSFYFESIDDYGSGDFNVTLPVGFYDRRPVALNDTIVRVRIECGFHMEVYGDHELVTVVRAEDLIVRAGEVSLTKSNPPFEFGVGSGGGFSVTALMDMTVNRTVLQSLNATDVGIAYECMIRTDCEGYYAVNYVFSIRVDLWNRRPVAGVSMAPGLTFLALGLMSAGLLVLEINRSWPRSIAKFSLLSPTLPDN
jgi:hypothetical protein